MQAETEQYMKTTSWKVYFLGHYQNKQDASFITRTQWTKNVQSAFHILV